MTIYFCNAEPIDLNAIALMGVSVKVGDSPIGYFGTGLKFSIATLLRTGHQVTLIRNGEARSVEGEYLIVGGEGHGFGLIASCPEKADAEFIVGSIRAHEAWLAAERRIQELEDALASISIQCGNVIFNCEQRPADNQRHLSSWRGVKEFVDTAIQPKGAK